jgi:hypothetical protein
LVCFRWRGIFGTDRKLTLITEPAHARAVEPLA